MERSILDVEDGMVEVQSPAVNDTIGEIRRRRGRPPGTKNKPKEETLSVTLEGAIEGVFMALTWIAGFFGYEKTGDLTEGERKDGAKAFAPIVSKMPWLIPWLAFIGAPIWLLRVLSSKLRRKDVPAGNTDGPDNTSIDSSEPGPETEQSGTRPTLGTISAG